MKYYDVMSNGQVIGEVCQVKNGCTVHVWVNGKEYVQDFFIKNRRKLKMAIQFWLAQLKK